MSIFSFNFGRTRKNGTFFEPAMLNTSTLLPTMTGMRAILAVALFPLNDAYGPLFEAGQNEIKPDIITIIANLFRDFQLKPVTTMCTRSILCHP